MKDTSGIILSGYIQKKNIYYVSQSRSDYKINISEKALFEKLGEIIRQSENTKITFTDVDKKSLLQLIRDEKLDTASQLAEIESKIMTLEQRQDNLLDLQLD